MLELDDIQALFIAPPRYPFGRYTFVSFDSADAGRAWLAQLANQIPSAKVGLDAHASGQGLTSPVYVAFTTVKGGAYQFLRRRSCIPRTKPSLKPSHRMSRRDPDARVTPVAKRSAMVASVTERDQSSAVVGPIMGQAVEKSPW